MYFFVSHYFDQTQCFWDSGMPLCTSWFSPFFPAEQDSVVCINHHLFHWVMILRLFPVWDYCEYSFTYKSLVDTPFNYLGKINGFPTWWYHVTLRLMLRVKSWPANVFAVCHVPGTITTELGFFLKKKKRAVSEGGRRSLLKRISSLFFYWQN